MIKTCKHCFIELNESNASRAHGNVYRNVCKPCRVKTVYKYVKENSDARKKYVNNYLRRIGKIKQYPCQTCNKDCYKKYDKAFCSDECRFMSYVEKTDWCWLWKGPLNRGGYGKLAFRGNKTDLAHRVSYKLFTSDIENGKFVCHSCDVRNCVNPAHLWLGDHQENMADMLDKGRQKSKLSVQDVIKIRDLYKIAGMAQEKIAEIFNITGCHISRILKGKAWKHV